MSVYALYLERARALAARLGMGDGAVPTRELPDEGVFVRELEYVFTERGHEKIERAADVDELLWFVFRDLTFGMATSFEVKHRRRGEDARRQMFAKQAELLDTLVPTWGARVRVAHDAILAEHPFDDQLARRADRWGELIGGGMARAAAVAQATREYP